MHGLARTQTLAQVGKAMRAQANQGVLSLLR
jgi:hypothetical protein